VTNGDTWCAVLGSPIAHSLSPAMHRAAYAELGLDWRYEAYEVDESQLESFIATAAPGLRGLSLTMPLKRVALDLADAADDTSRLVGAANTLLIEPDGSRIAANTDVPGLVRAFAEHGITTAESAIVLGAGATAASALAAVSRLGVRAVTVVVRSAARVEQVRDLAADLGIGLGVATFAQAEQVGGHDLVVSTVPGGAADAWAEHFAAVAPVVFDVAYHPWPTLLAVAASNSGAEVLSGLDLLVHQASLQVEMMTGRSPAPLAAMRAAAREELIERDRGVV
jgi:shikimate dehydrogenase